MTEQTSSSEIPQYNREQVIEVFRRFVDKGIPSPDDLDLSNPEVIAANQILDSWSAQEEAEAKKSGTRDAKLQYELDRSTILVDAGFLDPDYLDEVANDWLAQDLQVAEDEGLTDMATKIQTKIDEINAIL